MKESTKCPLKEPAVVIDAWSQEENRKKGKSFSEPPRLEVKVGKQPRKRRHASRTGPVRTFTGHVHTWPAAPANGAPELDQKPSSIQRQYGGHSRELLRKARRFFWKAD